jgi:hypothetical protein
MYLMPIALGGRAWFSAVRAARPGPLFFEAPMIVLVAILVAVSVLTAGLDVPA